MTSRALPNSNMFFSFSFSFAFAFAFFALVQYADGAVVGVYRNRVSTCNLNSATSNLMCTTRDSDKVYHYYNIQEFVSCDYHYCVTFREDRTRLSCTGFRWWGLWGTYLNPLSPLEHNVGDSSRAERISFLGSSVLVDSFGTNVNTYLDQPIEELSCGTAFNTCVHLSTNATRCFGIGPDVVFLGSLASLFAGMGVSFAASFSLYTGPPIMSRRLRSGCAYQFLVAPMGAVIVGVVVLFAVKAVSFKLSEFFIGYGMGTYAGYLFSHALFTRCLSTRVVVNADVGFNWRDTDSRMPPIDEEEEEEEDEEDGRSANVTDLELVVVV